MAGAVAGRVAAPVSAGPEDATSCFEFAAVGGGWAGQSFEKTKNAT